MSEERLNEIQELIERKILLAEVSGGLTATDIKLIDLWNYAMELQQELIKYKNIISDLKFAIKSNCIKIDNKYQEICCDGDYLLEILKDKEEE